MRHFQIDKSDETPIQSIGIEIAIPYTVQTKDQKTMNVIQNLRNEVSWQILTKTLLGHISKAQFMHDPEVKIKILRSTNLNFELEN